MAVTTYECSECGALLKSPQELAAGKKIRCPKCSKVFTIGGAPVAQAAKPAGAGKAAASAAKAAPAPAPAKVDDEDEGGNYSFKQDDGPPPPTLAELTRGKKKKGKDDDDEDDEVEYDDLGEEKPKKKKKKGFKKKNAGGGGAGKKVVLIIAGILVVLLLAGSGAGAYLYLNWYKNKGTGNEDPLAFLPADTSIVVFANTGSISSHPGGAALVDQVLKGAGDDDILKNIKSEAGIDQKDLMDQVYIGGKAPENQANAKAPFTMVCKSKVAFDQNKMRAALKDRANPERVGWRTYFKLNNVQNLNWVYMPSDRVIVFSNYPEADIQAVVGSKTKQPLFSAELVSLIQTMDKDDAWVAMAINDSARQQMKGAPGMPAMPPTIEAGIAKAKTLGLAATLSGSQVKANFTIDCGSDSAAKHLADEIAAMWNKQKLMFSMTASVFGKSGSTFAKDLTQSLSFTSKGSHANASAQVGFEALRDTMMAAYDLGKAAQQQPPQQMQRGGPRGGFPGPGGPGGRRGGRRGGGP